MLILKNNAARLITINHLVGEQLNEYQILPGDNEPTKVPNAVKELDFVKALLNAGDLSIVDTIEDEDEEDNGLAALQEEAKSSASRSMVAGPRIVCAKRSQRPRNNCYVA